MLKNITMKKKMFYALSALLLCSACTTTPRNPFEEPARPAGQESVLKLACEPLDTVRVGFIGLGSRGKGAIERYVYLPDAKVVALCDLDSANVNKANEILTSHKLPVADIYVGEDVWKEMCGRDDIDLVYICTDWHSHAPMAVYAMKQGKHVAVVGRGSTGGNDRSRVLGFGKYGRTDSPPLHDAGKLLLRFLRNGNAQYGATRLVRRCDACRGGLYPRLAFL